MIFDINILHSERYCGELVEKRIVWTKNLRTPGDTTPLKGTVTVILSIFEVNSVPELLLNYEDDIKLHDTSEQEEQIKVSLGEQIKELGKIRLAFSSFNPLVLSLPKKQMTTNSFSVIT